jgi:4-amino-4-deoxy-L-arabinose transferase-like glycosyltransferase
MHAEKQTFSDNRYFAFGSFYVQNPPMTHWINNLSSAVGHELLQKCNGNKIVVLGQ